MNPNRGDLIVGKFLEDRRMYLELSLNQVADVIGYKSHHQVMNIERGRFSIPADRLVDFSRAYQIEWDWLFLLHTFARWVNEQQPLDDILRILGETSPEARHGRGRPAKPGAYPLARFIRHDLFDKLRKLSSAPSQIKTGEGR